MDMAAWMLFIAISVMFSWILALLIKFIFGKYFSFFVPIPTFFIMLFILITMIALEALGLPISNLYAAFFTGIAGILKSGGVGW